MPFRTPTPHRGIFVRMSIIETIATMMRPHSDRTSDPPSDGPSFQCSHSYVRGEFYELLPHG